MTLPRLALLSVILPLLTLTSCTLHTHGVKRGETSEKQIKQTIRDNETSGFIPSGAESIQLIKISLYPQKLKIIPNANYASPELDGRQYRNIEIAVTNNSRYPDEDKKVIAALKESWFFNRFSHTITDPARINTRNRPKPKTDTLTLLIDIDPFPIQNTLYTATLKDSATGIIVGRYRSTNGIQQISDWMNDFSPQKIKGQQPFLTRKLSYRTETKISLIPYLIPVFDRPDFFFFFSGNTKHEIKTLPTSPTRRHQDTAVLIGNINNGTICELTAKNHHDQYTRDYRKANDGLMERDSHLCFKKIFHIERTHNSITLHEPWHNRWPESNPRTYTSLYLIKGNTDGDIDNLIRQAHGIISREWPGIRIITEGTPSPGDLVLNISIKYNPNRIVYRLIVHGDNTPSGYGHEPYAAFLSKHYPIHTLRKFLLFMEGRSYSPNLYSETQTLDRKIHWPYYFLFYNRYITTVKTDRTFVDR